MVPFVFGEVLLTGVAGWSRSFSVKCCWLLPFVFGEVLQKGGDIKWQSGTRFHVSVTIRTLWLGTCPPIAIVLSIQLKEQRSGLYSC